MVIIKWDVKDKSKIWRGYIMCKVLGTGIWFMNSDEMNKRPEILLEWAGA